MGMFFGYPSCCIEATVQRCNGSDFSITREQESVHQGTGFVPCQSCAQDIIAGKTTLEGLIQNRVSSLPFPDDEQARTQKEVNNFVDGLLKMSNDLKK